MEEDSQDTVAPSTESTTVAQNITNDGITIPEGKPIVQAKDSDGSFFLFQDRTIVHFQNMTQSQIDEIESRGVAL